MSLLSLLALGLVLGMRHATDADHVVAVTAIVSRERSVRAAALIGALWGLGHSLTVGLVGGAIVVFRWAVPPRLGLSLEMAVAAMLVVLGGYNLVNADKTAGKHAHGEHGARTHGHGEPARPTTLTGTLLQRLGLASIARPLTIGIVHGLAGSAAVALLVLTTVREARWAGLYLAVFGLGTVAGMVALTLLVAGPTLLAARWMDRSRATLVRATGLVSIAVGLALAYRIGFVGGLFSAHPVWTPE